MGTKVKITLEVEMGAGTPEALVRLAQGILCDALGEFRSVRTPARRYVENRYPKSEYPNGVGGIGEEMKIAEVEMRARFAEEFRNAAADGNAYSWVEEDNAPILVNSWWRRKSDGLMLRCDHEVQTGVYYFYLANGMAYAKAKAHEVRAFAENVPEPVEMPSIFTRDRVGHCVCGARLENRVAFYRQKQRHYCPDCAPVGAQKYSLAANAETGGEHYILRCNEFKGGANAAD